MRVPFPVKVFIAFLAVVAAGAVPTYVYIEASFADQLAMARVEETSHRASLLAESMRPLDRNRRLAHVQAQSKAYLERITYIGPTGVVLFDSSSTEESLDDHGTRPEVLAALGTEANGSTLPVKQAGIGAARRVSESTGVASIYVAVRIDEAGEIVRLAFPAKDIVSLADRLRVVFRNSQALALSVALLLSVLAAFVFMRPLQRLARSARAIARGDLTASETWRGTDEIGDVGLALNAMATELRKRLATAEASESLLIQAAEFLELPLAIVGRDGEIVVINGPFRRMVEDSTTDAEDVVIRLLSSKKYVRAVREVRDGNASGVLKWTKKKIGVVLQMHLLERPGVDPLVLLTVHDERMDVSGLPEAADLHPVSLEGLLAGAIRRARSRAPGCEFVVEYVDVKPTNTVVDVEGRVELALAVFLEAAGQGVEQVKLCASASDVTVQIWVDGELPAAPLRLVRHLLGPCGGYISNGDYVTLHVGRA